MRCYTRNNYEILIVIAKELAIRLFSVTCVENDENDIMTEKSGWKYYGLVTVSQRYSGATQGIVPSSL